MDALTLIFFFFFFNVRVCFSWDLCTHNNFAKGTWRGKLDQMLLLKNFYSNSSVKSGRKMKKEIAYILRKISYCREEKSSYESHKVQSIMFHGDWTAVLQAFPACVSLKCFSGPQQDKMQPSST